ncbi:DNA-binding transcriptional regulator, AcrR family [Desulfomicrobium norvegicum]|uniref:DNA-binding transcriptional regulator, AcrR family n=1 Tax=Desulfomicrobium norvegicum (strain DSM 1741 / NCIMB 8310) TaxID=52561 RepID=A0A8G2C415_DESNO|nr:TetR/AcrR family transcriptional regulator [Desulfomicrobium norvegicum]SFL90814.1 DNA-binding transcriptional regulator, AcrR family [Desulfomicrobium norvegicum]
MPTAHKRKKQPEIVRSKLIECAARIITEKGPNAVTIQAVADAAGVTKGGLLHHFKNKNQLSEAVSRYFIEQLDTEISKLMAEDSVEYGRFTRAYINSIWKDVASGQEEQLIFFAFYALSEPQLKSMYNEWMKEKQKLHHNTDSDKMLQVLRYAADGIWFEVLMKAGYQKEHSALLSSLIKMTYSEGVELLCHSIKE